jgi:hypothetical protein
MSDIREHQGQQSEQQHYASHVSNGREQQLERQHKIRQVTNIQGSWTEQERGEEGAFTLQLILDNGVDEYILRPDADDLDVLLKLFSKSNHTVFDMERKVLIFGNIAVK